MPNENYSLLLIIATRRHTGISSVLRTPSQLSLVIVLIAPLLCRRILSYLIPIRLLKGVLPSHRLLDNYPALSQLYEPLVRAYRIGDLKGYDDALSDNRAALISGGTFLIMERVREGCLRTLFKRVCVMND